MEEKKEKIIEDLNSYTYQFKKLESEIEFMLLTLNELGNALHTLENLKEGEGLINIGGGNYIFGKFNDSHVLVPIGMGYLISMKKYEAIEKIKERMKIIESDLNKRRKEMEKVGEKISDLYNRTQRLTKSS